MMEKNNSIFLETSDIHWDQSNNDKKELPKQVEMQWSKKDWSSFEVSDWLSMYFNAKVKTLNIKEVEKKEDGG